MPSYPRRATQPSRDACTRHERWGTPHWALRCKLMWILVASSRLVGFTQLPMCTAERRRTRQSKWNERPLVTLHDGGVRGLAAAVCALQHAYGRLPALIGLHGGSRQEDTRVKAHGVRVNRRMSAARASLWLWRAHLGWANLNLSRWNLERFPDATRFFSSMKALGCMVNRTMRPHECG